MERGLRGDSISHFSVSPESKRNEEPFGERDLKRIGIH